MFFALDIFYSFLLCLADPAGLFSFPGELLLKVKGPLHEQDLQLDRQRIVDAQQFGFEFFEMISASHIIITDLAAVIDDDRAVCDGYDFICCSYSISLSMNKADGNSITVSDGTFAIDSLTSDGSYGFDRTYTGVSNYLHVYINFRGKALSSVSMYLAEIWINGVRILPIIT